MVDSETKAFFEKSKKFFSKKNVQWIITAIILLVIIFTATSIRLSNVSLLVDPTSGNYTLSDPDALLWMRLEGHLLQYGNLNGIDTMRYPALNVTYSHEMLVYVVVDAYKIISSFDNKITYQFLDVVYPAYAFLIGLIIFFFLIYVLTNSKTAAILASAFLAYSPAYLFRTISGVSGHEALGIMFLFAVFLAFVLGIKKFSKNWKQTAIWSIVVGLLTTFSFASWGGTINFIFLILPLALLLYYLFNIEEDNIKLKYKFIAFYFIWILTATLGTLLVNFTPSNLYSIFFEASGALVPAVLLFVLVDTILNYYKPVKKSKFRLIFSAIATLVLGFIGLATLGKGGFGLISNIYQALIHPLGTNRVGLTVAYYAQPYLTDFQSQTLLSFFWIFLLGLAIICIEITKGVKSVKHRIYLSIAGIAAIAGILFSRYSSSSVLNGVNFLSQSIYFLSFAILVICLLWIYYKDKHKIDDSMIFIFPFMMIMLITVRAAARTIFMVVPFMALAGGLLIVKSAEYMKKSKGHERAYVAGGLLVVALALSFFYLAGNPFTSSSGAYVLSSAQAKQVGPLTNDQWENAMAWVRNDTAPGSVFLHWWDYGYILQTIGLRTTVLDGGNYNAYWDHLMGRYVLTTPDPNTAFAFMKAQNVSYLLIDFTDFGKYSAFSSIGSDSNGTDRFAAPTLLASDPSQQQNTSNGTVRVYLGQTFVDQDIVYQGTFLPGVSSTNGGVTSNFNSYLIGTVMSYSQSSNGSVSIQQPDGVFYYNNQRYSLPLRYVYYNNNIIDFGTGINATFMIIPSLSTQSGRGRAGRQGDPGESRFYLCSKTT